MNTIGCDVSFWQGEIDFHKMKAAGAEFVFIKASQGGPGVIFMDDRFWRNWKAAKEAGLLRGAYHFADYRHSAREQAEFFAHLLMDDPGELPPVLDYELKDGWPTPSRQNNLNWIDEFVEYFNFSGGKRPLFYCNTGFLKYNLPNPLNHWILDHDLWIAWYPNLWARLNKRVPIVDPWDKWTFWQHTAHGNGKKYGVSSGNVDMNYFNGTVEELQAYASIETDAPELTLEEKVDVLWEAHPEVWR